MVQQSSDLPEGTDSIISGAMETGKTGSASNKTAATAKSASSGSLMEKVRSQSGKLGDEAADKARGFVGQGLERSSEALTSVSKIVSDTASGLDDKLGKDYGDYARRAAQALDSTATRLAGKDPDELIDDTREFVRKSPGVALAGAAIVGFALARLIKSGLSSNDDDDANTKGRKRS